MNLPLVSCIMPTRDRRRFVERAIGYFLRQSYPEKELIILDDGDDVLADLIPDDRNVWYTSLSKPRSVGEKRNMMNALARGEFVAHFDDDDWQHPDRLARQVTALMQQSADRVCGLSSMLYYDMRTHLSWRYTYHDPEKPWVAGNSLMYRHALWTRRRFHAQQVCEDIRFLWDEPRLPLLPITGPLVVGVIHKHNVASKHTDHPLWHRVPDSEVEGVVGEADFKFLQEGPY